MRNPFAIKALQTLLKNAQPPDIPALVVPAKCGQG